jgi:hypothetical protein
MAGRGVGEGRSVCVGEMGVLVGGTSVMVAGGSVAVLCTCWGRQASRLRNKGISASVFFIFFSIWNRTKKRLMLFLRCGHGIG